MQHLQTRDEELDGLFERIYEDNVSCKLSDDRFAKMSRRYEDEQKAFSEKIKVLRTELEKQSHKSMSTDMFIATVRKYTRARKLPTPDVSVNTKKGIIVNYAPFCTGFMNKKTSVLTAFQTL